MPTNPGTTGLVAWWSLDEASGSRADSHSGGHTLSAQGTPGNRAGVVSNGVDLDGPTHYLYHADAGDEFRCPTGTSVTIACWARFDAMPAADAYPVSRWGATGDWAINVRPDGSVQMIAARTAGFDAATTPAGVVTTGAWCFLTGWYDHAASANGTAYIQVNAGTVYSQALAAAKVSQASAYVSIGDLGHTDVVYGDMNGGVDEAAVWLVALTSDNRDWLYNAGAGRAYSALSPALGLPIIAHHYRAVFGGGR